MTKSEMFKKAHKIARVTKEIAGSYRIAFACALKDLYAGLVTMVKTLEECAEILAYAQKERETVKKYTVNSISKEYKEACKKVVEAEAEFKKAEGTRGQHLRAKHEAMARICGFGSHDTSDAFAYI